MHKHDNVTRLVVSPFTIITVLISSERFFFYGVYTFNTIITAALHLRYTYSITCILNRTFNFQNIIHSIAYIISVFYYTC